MGDRPITHPPTHPLLSAIASFMADACPCHWHLEQICDEVLSKGVTPPWADCPCRGMMAADVSNGDFLHCVVELCNKFAVELAIHLPSDIDDHQRTVLLEEFDSARNHILFVLVVKMTHVGEAPCVSVAVPPTVPFLTLLARSHFGSNVSFSIRCTYLSIMIRSRC